MGRDVLVNPDLTTLLTIVLLGDRPLFGPPPGELLDPVLMDDCVTAMVSDIDVFMDELRETRGTFCFGWRVFGGRSSPV